MAAKDLALQLLSQGLQASVVAATVGVQESYISQLMADEDFRSELESRHVQQSEQDVKYDDKLDRVEDQYLDRIEGKLHIANLQQSMQAFKILNGAKRRKDRGLANITPQTGVVVQINLPVSIAPRYITNQQNEIVEVEGQTMVSVSPKKLDALVQERKPAETPAQLELAQNLQAGKAERTTEVLQKVGPVSRRSRKNLDLFSADML
jgi:hypothetical protein